MQKTLAKGFTLIELLVVIAIIGILAAVVLVAINPAERFKEANDTKAKSGLGDVATASQACFTNDATGNFNSCDDLTSLKDGGWMKSDPSVPPSPFAKTGGTEIEWQVPLTAQSSINKYCGATGTQVYLIWDSATNTTYARCTAITAYMDATVAANAFKQL